MPSSRTIPCHHPGGPMIRKLLGASACVAGMVSVAHAETWTMGLELVDQWSTFTCPLGSLTDRFWQLTLEGSRLNANGPDGVSWTATVSAEGAFKSSFTGQYPHQYYRHDYGFTAEMTGNARADPPWALLHNLDGMCWYKLVPMQ